MIECIKNKDGDITAVCEWLCVDSEGMLDDKGENIIICEVIINREYRGNGTLKNFMRILLKKNPQAAKCAWVREYKYKGRRPRHYTRRQIERYTGE